MKNLLNLLTHLHSVQGKFALATFESFIIFKYTTLVLFKSTSTIYIQYLTSDG